jgi:hypothetical protein
MSPEASLLTSPQLAAVRGGNLASVASEILGLDPLVRALDAWLLEQIQQLMDQVSCLF